MKKSIIEEKSFLFATKIVRQSEKLQKNNKEYILSKQLLKSRTSIGANVAEANAAQTHKDFIAKMAIASKEARETYYWIKLLKATGYIDNSLLESQCEEIIKILTSIVKTAMKNQSARNEPNWNY